MLNTKCGGDGTRNVYTEKKRSPWHDKCVAVDKNDVAIIFIITTLFFYLFLFFLFVTSGHTCQ